MFPTPYVCEQGYEGRWLYSGSKMSLRAEKYEKLYQTVWSFLKQRFFKTNKTLSTASCFGILVFDCVY
jgi:hypothetical protein